MGQTKQEGPTRIKSEPKGDSMGKTGITTQAQDPTAQMEQGA